MADINEIYSSVASNLQNILIAFLSFLLLLSIFVFFPYYFLVDSYKVVQNMDFIFNRIDNSLGMVSLKLSNYSQYKVALQSIPANVSLVETNALKANISLRLEKELLQSANTNIHDVSGNLSQIESINSYYKIIGKIDMKNMNDQITNYGEYIEKKVFQAPINISVLEYENFLILLPQKIYPASVENKKIDLEKEYANLSEDIKDLKVPIVGSFPFRLNQMLLFFPAIIAIGFPFISIQFKKLMVLNKKIILPRPVPPNHIVNEPVTKDDIVSWLDPLQRWPDKFYALLAILLPCAIFLIFLSSITLLFYSNIIYSEQEVLDEKNLLFLTEDTRLVYTIGNLLFGFVSFATSFVLMWKARN